MKDHRDVLLRPVVSEKSYGLLEDNVYTFVVAPSACDELANQGALRYLAYQNHHQMEHVPCDYHAGQS